MIPKTPCTSPVCLTLAGKGMLTVIPIKGFGFKQADPGQFRGSAACCSSLQTPWLHKCLPLHLRDTPLMGMRRDLPSKEKRVSAQDISVASGAHHQPWSAHPELAQCSLTKCSSRPLLTCANTCPMQDRGPRENGK